MLDSRLTFNIFDWDMRQVDNYSNWSSAAVFLNMKECNLDILKRKCAEYDCNKLKVEIQQKPKCQFKVELVCESYVTPFLAKYQVNVC